MKDVVYCSPSMLERVQRVRSRMHVEDISGVYAEDKTAFLAACLTYEQEFSSTMWHKDREDSWTCFKQWTDWRDWN